MPRNILDKVLQFNWGRDPERLFLKYRKMQASSFAFFRATCHLFYEDWAATAPPLTAPIAWICGDLHLENFGSFKGDDRRVYFGMNDFDEAILAPCTWELGRFLASVFVAAHQLKIDQAEAKHLAALYLTAYIEALKQEKSRNIRLETAEGLIKDLLEELEHRKRKEFLNRYTKVKKGKRQLIINPKKIVTVSADRHAQLEAFIASWAATQENPKFFRVLDVVGRLAGTASLGMMRYLLLVEGKGSPDRNYLLDLKQAHPACLQPFLTIPQPQWTSAAQRVETIQARMQAVPPALLHGLLLEKTPFLLRELQPTQDKLSLEQWDGKLERLEGVFTSMGRITAWTQLRSSGREGAAPADDLMNFAQRSDWQEPLLSYAEAYAIQVESDYQEFRIEFTEFITNK
jgi:uncharacterized protein (DUF2252 family)